VPLIERHLLGVDCLDGWEGTEHVSSKGEVISVGASVPSKGIFVSLTPGSLVLRKSSNDFNSSFTTRESLDFVVDKNFSTLIKVN